MGNLRILLCCIFGYILSYAAPAADQTTIYIDSTDGVTDETCGTKAGTSACQTLALGFSRLNAPGIATINLAGAFTLDRVFSGTTQTIQWATQGTKATLTISGPITTAAKAPIFSYTGAATLTGLILSVPSDVKTGSGGADAIDTLITTSGGLTMTSCDVTLTGATYAFPIWTVTAGYLMLNTVTVKKSPADTVSFSTALLSLTEAAEQSEVTVKDSAFEQISFTGTSPSTPSLIVAAKYKSLTLQDTLFNTITKAADNGPVLAATIAATGNAVTITGCDFFKCAASDTASKGGALAFTISTVAPTIESCCFALNTITSSATAEDVYFSTAPTTTPFTDCFSTAATGVAVGGGSAPAWGVKSIVYVGSAGSGTAGSYENPYTTFTAATLTAEKMIAVKTSVSVGETNTFENVITIRPSLELETAAVELSDATAGALTVGENGKVTVSNIEFTASASVTASKALWTMTDGELKLSGCSVNTKATPKTVPGLVSIAKGSVGIDDLSIADGVTLSKPPVVIDAAAETVSVTLSNLDMTGSTLAPLVSHAGDATKEATITLNLDHVKCPAGSAVSLGVKKQTTLTGAIKNCEVKDGSVYANIDAGKKLIFSSFSFQSCTAEPDEEGVAQGSGAALALELNGAADVQLGTVDELFPTELKAKHGQRILIVPKGDTTADTLKTTFDTLATNPPADGEEAYYSVKLEAGFAPLYYYTYTPDTFSGTTQTLYVSALGGTFDKCGPSAAPCLTVSDTNSKFKEAATTRTLTVKGEDAVVVGAAIEPAQPTTITSEDATKKGTIQIDAAANVFTITKAVSFESLKFSLGDGLTGFAGGVWAVGAGGALTLSKVEFVASDSLQAGGTAALDKITSTKALITTTGTWTTISLTECKFDSIEIGSTAGTASAAILSTTLGPDAAQTVEVKGCTFTKCTSRKDGSKAGALAFTLSGADGKVATLTFDIEGTTKNTFTGCNTGANKQDAISIAVTTQYATLTVKGIEFEASEDASGAFLSIDSSDANSDKAIEKGVFGDLSPSLDDETATYYPLTATVNSAPRTLALKHFLSSPEGAPQIYVDTTDGLTKAEFAKCGWSDVPCKTLSDGLEKATADPAAIIYTGEETFTANPFTGHTTALSVVKNGDSAAKWTLPNSVFALPCDLTLNGITIDLPETYAPTEIFTITGKTLTLTSCTFSRTTTATLPSLVKLTGGGVEIEGLTATGLEFDHEPVVVDGSAAGEATVKLTGKSDTQLTSAKTWVKCVCGAAITKTLNLDLKYCTVSAAEPVVSVTVGTQLTITGSLSHCTAPTSATGGAIFATSTAADGATAGTLIVEASFVGCATNFKGGAVYVDEKVNVATFTGCEFESCTSGIDATAANGGAVYRKCAAVATASTSFEDCFFIGNAAKGNGKGADVYFEVTGATLPSETDLPNLFTACVSDAENSVAADKTTPSTAVEASMGSFYIVGAAGTPGTACTNADPCGTLQAGIAKSTDGKAVLVKDSAATLGDSSSAAIAVVTLTVKGKKNEGALPSITATATGALALTKGAKEDQVLTIDGVKFAVPDGRSLALFTLTTGAQLALVGCEFAETSTPEKSFPCSIVSVTAGAVTVQEVSIAAAAAAPVVISENAAAPNAVSVTLKTVEMLAGPAFVSHTGTANTAVTLRFVFDHVKCVGGSVALLTPKAETTITGTATMCMASGGAVKCILSTAAAKLTASEFKFSSCIGEEEGQEATEYGAALHVQIDGECGGVTIADLSAVFLDGLAGESGAHIVVFVDDANAEHVKGAFAGVALAETDITAAKYALITTTSGVSTVSPLLYRAKSPFASGEGAEKTQTLIVDPAGKTWKTCGWEAHPCASFAAAEASFDAEDAKYVASFGAVKIPVTAAIAPTKDMTFQGAGATSILEFGNDGKFTVTKAVTFDTLKCTVAADVETFAGGVWVVGAEGSLTLNAITFGDAVSAESTPITATSALISFSDGWKTVALTKCTFNLITVSESDAAILEASVGEEQSVEVKACTFATCTSSKADAKAGALAITLSSANAQKKAKFSLEGITETKEGKETITPTTFEYNPAATNLKAVYVSITTANNELFVQNVKFGLPENLPTDHTVVFVDCKADSTAVLTKANWAGLDPDLDGDNADVYMVKVEGEEEAQTLSDFFIPPGPPIKAAYVDSEAAATGKTCASAADACKTIANALGNVTDANAVYIVGAAFAMGEAFTFPKKDLIATKDPKPTTPIPECTVTVAKAGKFTIEANTIAFYTLTFTSPAATGTMRKNDPEARDTQMFDVTGGMLILAGCTVKDVTISTAFSLITSAGDVALSESTFTTISNTLASAGKAAVLDGTIGENNQVEIQGCTFTTCTSKSGNAGALSLSVSGALNIGEIPAANQGGSATKTSFSGCLVKEDKQETLYIKVEAAATLVAVTADFGSVTADPKGQVLLVETDEESKPVVRGATWGLSPAHDADATAALYMVKVGAVEPVTLKDFIKNTPAPPADAGGKGTTELFVETEGGDDGNNCQTDHPCQTLLIALGKALRETNKISFQGEEELTADHLSISKGSTTISKKEAGTGTPAPSAVLKAAIATQLEVKRNITFKDITIQLTGTGPVASLFLVTDYFLAFENCPWEVTNDQPGTLASISGASVSFIFPASSQPSGGTEVTYVKKDATGTTCADNAANACSSITTALGIEGVKKVFVTGTALTEANDVTFTKAVAVVKDSTDTASTETTVTMTAAKQFKVQNAVEFSSLSFAATAATSVAMWAVSTANGQLTLSSCKVKTVTLTTTSLITIAATSSVVLTKTEFDTIANNKASGGVASVLEGTIGTGKEVKVTGCTFKKCTSTSGTAAVMKVVATGKLTLSPSADTTPVQNTFTGCTIGADAAQKQTALRVSYATGSAVAISSFTVSDKAVAKAPLIAFVGANADDAVLSGGTYTALSPTVAEESGAFYKVYSSDTDAEGRTLQTVIGQQPSAEKIVFVGTKTAATDGDCLKKGTACERLATAAAVSGATAIHVNDTTYTIGAAESLAKKLTVTKAADVATSTVTVAKAATVTIAENGAVTFKALSLQSAGTAASDASTASFFSVSSGGALTLDACTVTRAFLTAVPLINLASGGAVTLTGSTFTAASTDKAAVLEGAVAASKTVTVTGCTFTTCTSATGNAAAIKLAVDATGTLKLQASTDSTPVQNTFTGCTIGADTAQKQTALYISYVANAVVSVTSFTVSDKAVAKAPLIVFEGAADANSVLKTGDYTALSPAIADESGAYYVTQTNSEGATPSTLDALVKATASALMHLRHNDGTTTTPKPLVPTAPLVKVEAMTGDKDKTVSVTVKNIKDQTQPVVKYDSTQTHAQTLTMDLTVEGVEMADTAAATVVPVDLTVKGPVVVTGTFKDITSKSTAGGALKVKVNEGGRVLLKGTTFDNCKADGADANGGAVYVDLSGAGDRPTDSYLFKMEGVKFGETAPNSANKGKDVYIAADNAGQMADGDYGFTTKGEAGSVSLVDKDKQETDLTNKGHTFSDGDDDDGLSGGAIAGIVVGVIAFVAIVVVVVLLIVFWKLGKCCFSGGEDSGREKEMDNDEDEDKV